MNAKQFLAVFFLLHSIVVIAGNFLPSGKLSYKKTTVVPERRKTTPKNMGFDDGLSKISTSSLFTVVPVSPSTPKSSGRYSMSSSSSWGSLGVSEVITPPMKECLSDQAERLYTELWRTCVNQFSVVYELLRQVNLNFSIRLKHQAEALDFLPKKAELEKRVKKTFDEYCVTTEENFKFLKKYMKINSRLVFLAKTIFFFDVGVVVYWYGNVPLDLVHFISQRCQLCNRSFSDTSLRHLCFCGGNLVLPQNYREFDNLLVSLHRNLSLFIEEMRQFNKDLRANL